MSYEFKVSSEAVWFVVVSVLTPLLVALSQIDEQALTDWRPWAAGVVAAMVRALGGALLAVLSPPAQSR